MINTAHEQSRFYRDQPVYSVLLTGKQSATLKDDLRVDLALGAITFLITVLLLIILNTTLSRCLHPDVEALRQQVQPLSVWEDPIAFLPEPVERLQYQLSLVFTPVIILGSFYLTNKWKPILQSNQLIAVSVNALALLAFVVLTYFIITSKAQYVNLIMFNNDPAVPRKTNTIFFANNIIGKTGPVFGIFLYAVVGCAYFVYAKHKEKSAVKLTTAIISWLLAGIVIADIVMYDIFHLSNVVPTCAMETNAVFYSVTQVFAGKSLLVNLNSQYGLFAWFLVPLFRVIGLSTFKFTLVMAILTGLSYLFMYLAIKKLLKQELLSLITFLALVFWQFWQTRVPALTDVPRYYYQYAPIRFIFPSVTFLLIVCYHQATVRTKQYLLPVLAFTSSFAVLWNLDSGAVVYGAVFISLIFSALSTPSVKESLKQSMVYVAWMLLAFASVLIWFAVTTKVKSTSWPDFQKFTDFQKFYYISGFFMLRMSVIHFWNFVIAAYLATGVYCVFHFRKQTDHDLPVLAFLFILGLGLFSYFQGRSFDLNVEWVMHPAIILAGVFCSKLLNSITVRKPRFHESVLICFIPFLFLADGAFSMVLHTPAIHNLSVKNAFTTNHEKEQALKNRIHFIASHIPEKDSVIILARDYESYFYASGQYYNPVHLPGSTEMFFKKEVYTLLDSLSQAKYPVIYDGNAAWIYTDTIMEILHKYYTIEAQTEDHLMLLLKPRNQPYKNRLNTDANTIYYNDLGDNGKYVPPKKQLDLSDSFSIEILLTLDSTKLEPRNLAFTNTSKTAPKTGILMLQNGPDLTRYTITYGDGIKWYPGASVKLSTTTENHLLIIVRNSEITAYNNDILIATADTHGTLKNSDDIFFINANFAGTIHELKISDLDSGAIRD